MWRVSIQHDWLRLGGVGGFKVSLVKNWPVCKEKGTEKDGTHKFRPFWGCKSWMLPELQRQILKGFEQQRPSEPSLSWKTLSWFRSNIKLRMKVPTRFELTADVTEFWIMKDEKRSILSSIMAIFNHSYQTRNLPCCLFPFYNNKRGHIWIYYPLISEPECLSHSLEDSHLTHSGQWGKGKTDLCCVKPLRL